MIQIFQFISLSTISYLKAKHFLHKVQHFSFRKFSSARKLQVYGNH